MKKEQYTQLCKAARILIWVIRTHKTGDCDIKDIYKACSELEKEVFKNHE